MNTKGSKRGSETINGEKQYKGVDAYKDTKERKGSETITNKTKEHQRRVRLESDTKERDKASKH